MTQNTLTGKVILLTGASSGIGWATALELLQYKPRLALVARRADKLRELAALAKAEGVETLELPCDVGDRGQCLAAVEAVKRRWGRVDILVNNAGLMATENFHAQSLSNVEEVLRVNYLGAATFIHAVLPGMLERREGHIVNVASIAGLMGFPYMASYCASKFALVGLTEALRREYYGTGITLTALCPGSVRTPMAEESLKDERMARVARPKTAEQVARKIVSCCLNRTPELIYGDAPGLLVRLGKFVPRLIDWTTHQVYRRIHPLARRPL